MVPGSRGPFDGRELWLRTPKYACRMPPFAPAEPRKRLALAGLALPILGMIGLFAWAGGETSQSTTGFVSSFLSAYNARDCQAILADLHQSPGRARATCAELHSPTSRPFLDCTLTVESASSGLPAVAPTPSGFSGPQTVLASCKGVSVYFEVAVDDATGRLEVVGAQLAP